MTTRYKLPDRLGGREVVAVPHPTGAPPLTVGGEPAVLVAFPVTAVRMVVPKDVLIATLPPEPPNGTVYSNEADVWIRCDDPEIDPKGRWWVTGSEVYERWRDVAPKVTAPGWCRYVPAPADDPALVERVAQAMRDANKPEAWIHQQIAPFDHFAQVAVDTILRAAREAEKP